ncbi:MAG: cytochrome b/b6 domain-containing protein [Pseudohaliea sp.]
MNRVWDRFLRSYHWLQALLFVLLCVSGFAGDGQGLVHHAAGVAIAVLALWRVLWGFAGSDTARFSHFLPRVSTLRHYLRTGEYRGYGHNPLAAIMVLLMLALLVLQIGTGFFASELINMSTTVAFADRASDWHARLIGILLAATGAHVLAAITHELKGDRVIMAMLHGRQAKAPAGLCFQGVVRAFFLLAVSLVLVLLLVSALGQLDFQIWSRGTYGRAEA